MLPLLDAPAPDGGLPARLLGPGQRGQAAGRAPKLARSLAAPTGCVPFPGPDGSIAHAEIQIGDLVVIVEDEDPRRGTSAPPADGLPGMPEVQFIYVEDVDATMARAAELGATVKRAPETQFYGDRDGFLIDPFGHGWTVASHVEDVSGEEMGRRMAELFGSA